jgi:hypothetical protein
MPVIFEINLARRVFYSEPVRGVPDIFGGNEAGDLPGGPYTNGPVPGGPGNRGSSQSPGVYNTLTGKRDYDHQG